MNVAEQKRKGGKEKCKNAENTLVSKLRREPLRTWQEPLRRKGLKVNFQKTEKEYQDYEKI